MKLAHPILNTPIEWDEFYINTFIIENPNMYRDFLTELYDQEQGLRGSFVLSHGLEIMEISKNIEILNDILRINTDTNKKILNGIAKELTDIAINDYTSETYELYRTISQAISNVIFASGSDLIFDDINDISQIFKMYNVRPDIERLSLAEKILLHMELCEKYLKKKLFVVENLHSYFTNEELVLLFADFQYRKHRVLIIERYDCEALKQEKKRIIDPDLCEI